jgi:hypothetical protein
MIAANNFNAPAYRVETAGHRLIKTFDNLADALDCASKGQKQRLIYRHNRPSGTTEGNYTLLTSA